MKTRAIGYLALAATIAGVGCAALKDDMRRAERAYESARYNDTLVWLEDLEDHAPGMDLEMRARYYYLRGMTEYRLGHRLQALHYLAVAREVAADEGAGLRPEWRRIMERTLEELTPRGATYRPPEAQDEATGRAAGREATEGATPDAEPDQAEVEDAVPADD